MTYAECLNIFFLQKPYGRISYSEVLYPQSFYQKNKKSAREFSEKRQIKQASLLWFEFFLFLLWITGGLSHESTLR